MIQTQRQNTKAFEVSAPIRGIVATGIFGGGGAEKSPDSAIWLFNMIAGELGTRVRTGSREFATGIPDSASNDGEVRTLIYYNSTVSGVATDQYFAVTDKGIYDVTAGGAGPHTEVLAWPNPGSSAGWCSVVNYTLVNGAHNLLVCDEANGYYIFDGTTWTVPTLTGASPPDAVDLVQVSEWQGRVWFVERNTARAWFLDPLALSGNIVPLDVGSRFKKGGHLVQITTWSIDAGDGINDKLVMVSSGGDVLIWAGSNPTAASDMTLEGRWVVGAVPEGRRVMSDWGGDVLILSTNGIVKISEIYSGRQNTTSNAFFTANIARYIRSEMNKSLNQFGWSIELVPNEGVLVVTVPKPPAGNVTQPPIQFVMDTTTLAWSMFRDLTMVCQDKNAGGYFFGTDDGRVMQMYGGVDNHSLDGVTFKPINFSMLTHYSDLGLPGRWKRPQFLRPSWIANTPPAFNIRVLFDHDLKELVVSPNTPVLAEGDWDVSLWDAALWGSGGQAFLETRGTSGMGRFLAIGLRGEAVTATSYLGTTLMADSGGLL